MQWWEIWLNILGRFLYRLTRVDICGDPAQLLLTNLSWLIQLKGNFIVKFSVDQTADHCLQCQMQSHVVHIKWL